MFRSDIPLRNLTKRGGNTLGRLPAHQPIQAPRQLEGFPGARRARPKTTFAGGLRARWHDVNGNILEWDSRHGTVECYSPKGLHIGEFSADTGKLLKPADPARRIVP